MSAVFLWGCSPSSPAYPTPHYAYAPPDAKQPPPASPPQSVEPPLEASSRPPDLRLPPAEALPPAPAPPPPRYPFHEPLPSRLSPNSPAMRYANLQPWQCRKELTKRKLPLRRDGAPAKGIATSLRFTGPLYGVTFVAPGRKSPYGKLDCRLALVLDDFAQLLARHEIVEVRVDNMYRPNARLPRSRRKSQHNYGLAIDITQFKTKDGLVLDVEEDWSGERGQPVCGPESALQDDREASIKLRNLVCDAARAGLFHHMLTPNYNAAHRDHLHLDIKRDAKYGSIN